MSTQPSTESPSTKKPYSDFNQVIIKGNLTRDPEVRYTASGTIIVNGSIGNHQSYDGKNGRVEETHYFDFSLFGKKAEEWLSTQPRKGLRVTIEGRLTQRRWQTEDGQKRSKVEIRAFSITGPNDMPAPSPDQMTDESSYEEQA
jgi:single-strand DNA-binding protein